MSSFTDIYSTGWMYNSSGQDTTIVCSSDDNELIPIFASDTNLESSPERIIYKMYSISSIGTGEKTSKFKRLTNYVSTNFVKYGGTTLFIRKGLIYTYSDNGQVLYLLVGAAPKQYIREGSTESGDPVLLIHPLVFTDVKYKNVKYYVNKYFIKETVVDGFEVIITSKIVEKCFNPMSVVSEFASVRSRNKHLKDMRIEIGLEGEPSLELMVHPEDAELPEEEQLPAPSTVIPGMRTEIREITVSGEPVVATGREGYITGIDPYLESAEIRFLTADETERLNSGEITIQELRGYYHGLEVQVPINVISISSDNVYVIRVGTENTLVVPQHEYEALVRGDITTTQIRRANEFDHNIQLVSGGGLDEDIPIAEEEQIQIPVEELREQFGDLADIAAEFADAEEPVADISDAAQIAMNEALIVEHEQRQREAQERGERIHQQVEDIVESMDTEPNPMVLAGSSDFIDAFRETLRESVNELPTESLYPIWRTLSRRGQNIEIVDDTEEIIVAEAVDDERVGRFPSATISTNDVRAGVISVYGTRGDMEGSSDAFLESFHNQGLTYTSPASATTSWLHTNIVTDLNEDAPYFFVDDESEIQPNYD